MKKQIGLGLAALGRPGYINLGHDEDIGTDKSRDALREQAFAVLDAAWAAGIRYFDAARSYGRAEEFLGGWLRQREISAADVMIASKWGYYYTANWQVDAEEHEIKEHSLNLLKQQISESRGYLGDQLDLYQIHSATPESGVLENQAVLDELQRLKEGGLQIGLSVSGPQQTDCIQQALGIERDGRLLFDSVQATWNLLEGSATNGLTAAHDAGLLVVIKEALANGRLTGRNNEPVIKNKRARIEELAKEHDCGIDAISLAAALSQPWASVVLSGAARTTHLQSNLEARKIHLDQTELQEFGELAEDPDEYWQRRSKLEWN